MSRRITIATFSTVPPAPPAGASLDDAVQGVIDHWRRKIAKVLPDKPDLILLPEVADMPTGQHTVDLDGYIAARGERVCDFFAGIAREHRCYIAYTSWRPDEHGIRRNTLLMLGRDGRLAGRYHKRHVVIDEYTDCGVHYGDGEAIIECDFGRVACAICFDIYFEDARRRAADARPDLILFPSMVHGGLMQAHWAYSCRAHFVAALHIMRPSAILAPTGEIIASTSNYFDYVTVRVNLDCAMFHLDGNRPKLEAARAKYGNKLTLHDPGYLGAVLLTCEADDFTVHDVAREFKLECFDDYLNRSLEHRKTHCQSPIGQIA